MPNIYRQVSLRIFPATLFVSSAGLQLLRRFLITVSIIGALGNTAPAFGDNGLFESRLIAEVPWGKENVERVGLANGDILRRGGKVRLQITARDNIQFRVQYTGGDGTTSEIVPKTSLSAGQTAYIPSKNERFTVDGPEGTYIFKVSAFGSGNEDSTEHRFTLVSEGVISIGATIPRYMNQTSAILLAVSDQPIQQATVDQPIQQATVDIPNLDKDQPRLAHAYSSALKQLGPDKPGLTLRGSGMELYRKVASGVVLVVRGDGDFGSGSIISQGGNVLTNWHVVRGAQKVGVIFKPPHLSEVRSSRVYAAKVIRFDEVADLALLKIKKPPPNLTVVSLGSLTEVEVAMDVHAIGHPVGQEWTYTRGVISQVRSKYQWTDDSKIAHEATVIQTQTPINPGNSGGPLLSDDHKLIGVNSFRAPKTQGINFAVSVADVRNFLAASRDRMAKRKPPDRLSNKGGGKYKAVDTNDNGIDDLTIVDRDGNGVPDTYVFDENEDGEADYILLDKNENGKPDAKIIIGKKLKSGKIVNFWIIDTDEDGTPDLFGWDFDRDGEIDRYQKG